MNDLVDSPASEARTELDLSRVRYHEGILPAIGRTPLIRIRRMAQGLKGVIMVKAEFLNPGGSLKDRIAVQIVEAAERDGRLRPGGTIVEGTAGNTGVGLALVAADRGYRCIFTVPDKMSSEKIRMLRAYGAEVVVTPTAVPPDSPDNYIQRARAIAEATPGAIVADQFYNPANPEAHYRTTGPEIWEDTAGQVDYFVVGAGTGGCVTGVAKYLKEHNPRVKVVLVDPIGSIIRDYFYTRRLVPAHPYKVEGIGEDMIGANLQLEYVDEVMQVSDGESFRTGRLLARKEGLFVGGSSGTVMAGALRLARRLTEPALIVALFADAGNRYLSKMYSDDWMEENGFLRPDKVPLDFVLTHKRTAIPELVTVAPHSSVADALRLLQQYGVSQLPVMDGETTVGTVEESDLTARIIASRDALEQEVGEVMGPPLPRVDAGEPLEKAMRSLRGKNAAILVERYGSIVGLVTRLDLIEFMSS